MKTKRVKFNLFATIGMMVALGTVAFTAPTFVDNKSSEELVWIYTGSSALDHDDASKYVLGEESDKCTGRSEIRCTITAPEGASNQPDLSQMSASTFKP